MVVVTDLKGTDHEHPPKPKGRWVRRTFGCVALLVVSLVGLKIVCKARYEKWVYGRPYIMAVPEECKRVVDDMASGKLAAGVVNGEFTLPPEYGVVSSKGNSITIDRRGGHLWVEFPHGRSHDAMGLFVYWTGDEANIAIGPLGGDVEHIEDNWYWVTRWF